MPSRIGTDGLHTRGPRDPLVARDVLFGMVWGGAVAVLILASQVLSVTWGEPEPIPAVVATNLLLSFPLTLDLEAWNGGASVLVLACVAALTAYALRTSVLARPAANR